VQLVCDWRGEACSGYLLTCVRTVISVITSCSAISRLLCPCATRRSTPTSRSVNGSGSAGFSAAVIAR